MVFRQVGKGRHLKMDAAHPVQGQRMGGNLHHHMGTAGIAHSGKQRLQLKAFGGGALCGDHFIAHQIFHGADETHFGAQRLFQNMLQQQGHRCLAVGAGYPNHGHGFGRMAVEVCADHSKGIAVIFHQNIGNIGFRLFCTHHNGCALFHGHGNKPVAVGRKAGDGDEQASRCYLP